MIAKCRNLRVPEVFELVAIVIGDVSCRLVVLSCCSFVSDVTKMFQFPCEMVCTVCLMLDEDLAVATDIVLDDGVLIHS